MKIILAYKRRPELVDDIHLFDGYLQEDNIRVRLEGKTFAELIFKLSERLCGLVLTPHDEVAVIRLEQPSVVHPLSDEEVEMVRTQPTKYIEALTIPPQRIVLKVKDEVSVRDGVKTNIRAGIETLVDAFGDDVYIRERSGKYESPITGRWELPGNIEVWTLEATNGWAAVPTAELLNQKKERYYLPRIWNISGSWITHEDLQAKYDKYIEEKENADQ